MSNPSTTIQWIDLPIQNITGTTETALVVPAASAGYGTLPSPAFAAGNGLTLGLPQDLANNPTYDGHAFTVRVVAKVLTAGSYTFKFSLYEVPGTIVAAGTAGTLSNDHAVLVGPATSSGGAGTQSFIFEAKFLWDSTTKTLNGGVETFQLNGVNLAAGTPSGTAGQFQVTTQLTSVGLADIQFVPSFAFGTSGVNAVTVTEFAIDRN